MYYQVSKEFFEKLPNACFGAVAVRGLDNTHEIPELEEMLAGNVAECEAYFTGKKPDFTPPLHPIGRAHAAHGRALAGLQLAERLNLCHGCFPFLRRRLPPVPMVFGRVRAGAFLHRPWYYQGIH